MTNAYNIYIYIYLVLLNSGNLFTQTATRIYNNNNILLENYIKNIISIIALWYQILFYYIMYKIMYNFV